MDQLRAIEVGHLQLDQIEVKPVVAGQLQSLMPVVGLEHGEGVRQRQGLASRGLETFPEQLAGVPVGIDDKDPQRSRPR